MTFAQPLALVALFALLPLAAAAIVAARHRRAADAAYGGPPALRRGYSARRGQLRNVLLASAIALAAVAMARPQWGTADAPLERRGIDVVIALDISRSMLAADVPPTRAAAAAAGLREMLRHMGGDRAGLVTFAGSAFVRSPLTLDLDAVAELVARAQQEGALVQPGTDIGAALRSSVQLLDAPGRARTQVIVLISDGEDLGAGVAEAAAQAQADGVRIYTVAAGTAQGALVPAEPGARDVVDVTSRADREGLARIATASSGATRDVATIAGLAVEFARLRQSAFEQDARPVPVERFQWVLGAALALLIASTWLPEVTATQESRAGRTRRAALVRPGAAVAGLLVALVSPACSGTPAYQAVRAGNEAYAGGQFERALAAYSDAKQGQPDPAIDYNIANALFRRERYEEAAVAAKAAIAAAQESTVFVRATYTVGNAAFRRNALTEARDAYVTVLQRDPTDADARHNLELVLRALTPPPAQPQTPQPPEGSGQQPAPGATPAAGQPAPGTPPPGAAPPSGTPPPGASGDPSGTPGAGGTAVDAREALRRALEGLPDGVTAEEALAVLDAARRASEANTLGERPGARFDPNDR